MYMNYQMWPYREKLETMGIKDWDAACVSHRAE